MTTDSSFKRLVRTRMEKAGESYTAARAVLLAADGDKRRASGPGALPLPLSDGALTEQTGRGWEAWFDLLDGWGAVERSHKETARWVATQMGAEPLGWHAQAITVSYERARGLR